MLTWDKVKKLDDSYLRDNYTIPSTYETLFDGLNIGETFTLGMICKKHDLAPREVTKDIFSEEENVF